VLLGTGRLVQGENILSSSNRAKDAQHMFACDARQFSPKGARNVYAGYL